MTINKEWESERLTLSLSGRLNTATAQQLEEALTEALDEAEKINLDFTNLDYLSSAGLRVLLMGYKASKTKNVPIVISGVSDDVMDVLDMTGFCEILTIGGV